MCIYLEKQRPVSAKTDSKTGRLTVGQRTRPFSAKRLPRNDATTATDSRYSIIKCEI